MVRIVCRPRRRCASRSLDEGFTFVELVVALTILATGIVGVIGVMNNSFGVAGKATARSRMVALATKEVEALRAIPYKEMVDGYEMSGRHLNGEPCNLVPGPCAVTVETSVQTPTTGDRHRTAVVAVRWTDAAGVHEIHQSTFLYPGGIGAVSPDATTPTTAQNCTPPKPAGLVAAQVSDASQTTSTVDLSWTMTASTCQASNYVIRYVTSLSTIVNEVTRLATSTSYRVTGLTAGTTYRFEVASKSSSGQLSSWSDAATVTTAVWTGSTCKVGSITLTPPTANKKGNGTGSGLRDPVAVRVPTEGTCPGFNAVYKPTTSSTQTTPLVRQSDGAYTGALNKDVTWDVGRRYVDIIRTSDGAKVGSVLLTVCEHNVSNCA